MKRLILSSVVILISFALSNCSTVGRVMRRADDVDRRTERVTDRTGSVVGHTGPVVSGGIDFKEGEVLCGGGKSTMKGNIYHIGKVLQPASEQTKEQAEVLFIDSGNKKWTSFVIPSHKASKGELRVGLDVLYFQYGTKEPTDRKRYRFVQWKFGTITSDDEAYKNIYEIKGSKIHIGWIRIADLH